MPTRAFLKPGRSNINVTFGDLSRALASLAAVASLQCLRLLPPRAALFALLPFAKLYPRLRPAHADRLQRRFNASPYRERLTVSDYYRARLELLLRNLGTHGRSLEKDFIRVENARVYEDALRRNRPVALLGLHMGVVELLHRVPGIPGGKPFHIVTAPAFSPALTRFMTKGRERDGKRVFRNDDFASGLRSVIRNRGVLALMADQHPGRATGGIVELWKGIQIPFPASLLEFLTRHGACVLPVSTRVEADGRSVVRFHSAWDETGGRADAAVIKRRTREFLEEAIASAPEQWNWSYPKITVK